MLVAVADAVEEAIGDAGQIDRGDRRHRGDHADRKGGGAGIGVVRIEVPGGPKGADDAPCRADPSDCQGDGAGDGDRKQDHQPGDPRSHGNGGAERIGGVAQGLADHDTSAEGLHDPDDDSDGNQTD